MIEQEQARLEKIKQESGSDKVERRQGADYHERGGSKLDAFADASERENEEAGGFGRGCVRRAKGKEKPKAVFNRPDAMFVSLKDLNKTKITKKKTHVRARRE